MVYRRHQHQHHHQQHHQHHHHHHHPIWNGQFISFRHPPYYVYGSKLGRSVLHLSFPRGLRVGRVGRVGISLSHTVVVNVGKTMMKHPWLGMVYTSYTNGDDWGMVYSCFTMFHPHHWKWPAYLRESKHYNHYKTLKAWCAVYFATATAWKCRPPPQPAPGQHWDPLHLPDRHLQRPPFLHPWVKKKTQWIVIESPQKEAPVSAYVARFAALICCHWPHITPSHQLQSHHLDWRRLRGIHGLHFRFTWRFWGTKSSRNLNLATRTAIILHILLAKLQHVEVFKAFLVSLCQFWNPTWIHTIFRTGFSDLVLLCVCILIPLAVLESPRITAFRESQPLNVITEEIKKASSCRTQIWWEFCSVAKKTWKKLAAHAIEFWLQNHKLSGITTLVNLVILHSYIETLAHWVSWFSAWNLCL